MSSTTGTLAVLSYKLKNVLSSANQLVFTFGELSLGYGRISLAHIYVQIICNYPFYVCINRV